MKVPIFNPLNKDLKISYGGGLVSFTIPALQITRVPKKYKSFIVDFIVDEVLNEHWPVGKDIEMAKQKIRKEVEDMNV